MSEVVEISGVWVRRSAEQLQVLVEMGGEWRLVIDRPWPADGTGEISHIAEPAGKNFWPTDTLIVAPPVVRTFRAQSEFPCKTCPGCGRFVVEGCVKYPGHQHEWCDCQ